MKKGTGEAVKSQNDVKRISSEVLAGIHEIADGTKHITSAMAEISGFSNKPGERAEQLNSEVNKFKTFKY